LTLGDKTKARQLQQMVDERATDKNWHVEFRRFDGWYAVHPEPISIQDGNELYLGKNVTEATRSIRRLF
jgi:hypothetical protein